MRSWTGRKACPTSIRFVAGPRGVALVVVHHAIVGTEALLRAMTPEQPIAGMRHRWIPLRLDVHALPAQTFAAVVVDARHRRVFHFSSFRQPPAARASPRLWRAALCIHSD